MSSGAIIKGFPFLVSPDHKHMEMYVTLFTGGNAVCTDSQFLPVNEFKPPAFKVIRSWEKLNSIFKCQVAKPLPQKAAKVRTPLKIVFPL
jgi:hypothetical protein